MANYSQLDQLIQGYFNQDADLNNDGKDTIVDKIRLFTNTAQKWTLEELALEIDDFIKVDKNQLNEEFNRRYSFDFSPELWNTTAYDFLMTVRSIAASSKS